MKILSAKSFMIELASFSSSDFDDFISWINNEELLVTIAGTAFSYPLSREQLQNYLALEKSHSFTIIDAEQNKKIGHAEIVLSGEGIYKIDKLIIGDKDNRGKGIGENVIIQLLKFSFHSLNARVVELNVFDWNIGGIKCYRKSGFILNDERSTNFQVGDKNWTALNMTISRTDWNKKQNSHK